jgi:hypothetical protein
MFSLNNFCIPAKGPDATRYWAIFAAFFTGMVHAATPGSMRANQTFRILLQRCHNLQPDAACIHH